MDKNLQIATSWPYIFVFCVLYKILDLKKPPNLCAYTTVEVGRQQLHYVERLHHVKSNFFY